MSKDFYKNYLINNIVDDEITKPITSFESNDYTYNYEGRYFDIKQTYAYNNETEEYETSVIETDTQIYVGLSSRDENDMSMKVIHFRYHYIDSEDVYMFKDFTDDIMYYPDLMKLISQYSSCTVLVEMQDLTGKVIKLILIPDAEMIDSITMDCFVKTHTYQGMPDYVIYNSNTNKLEPLKEEDDLESIDS